MSTTGRQRVQDRLEIVEMTVGTLREKASERCSYEEFHAIAGDIVQELFDIGQLYGKNLRQPARPDDGAS